MSSLLVTALALWIVTHTVAREIPFTAGLRKPFSCQLCLAGWLCILTGVMTFIQAGFDLWTAIILAAAWGLSVLIEALYGHLRIVVL